jgi:hypothetical protein
MSNQHRRSRRATLKHLGTLGAVVAFGSAAPIGAAEDSRPATALQDQNAVSVVDVAVGRMAKGHS